VLTIIKFRRLVNVYVDFFLCADFGRTLPEQDLLEKQASHPRKESARKAGVTDFDQYAVVPGNDLYRDFFVPDSVCESLPTKTLSVYD